MVAGALLDHVEMQTLKTRSDQERSRAGRRAHRVPGRARPVCNAVTTLRNDTKAEYLYIYAGDDPINFTDPSGECIICSNPLGIVSGAKRVWHKVRPYVGTCLYGAAISAAAAGPEAAPEGCATAVGLRIAESSSNRYVRGAAVAVDVAMTYRSAARIAREGPYAYWYVRRLLTTR